MEIIKRYRSITIWRARDPEGRRTYSATTNWPDGTPIQPSIGCCSTRRQAEKLATWLRQSGTLYHGERTPCK